MKALSLHQPWASLVALGYKSIETRRWATHHRGPLAIHAAKRDPGRERWFSPELAQILCEAGLGSDYLLAPNGSCARVRLGPMPLGAVVAVVDLDDVVATEDVRWSIEIDRPYRRVVERSGVDHIDWYLVSERERPCGDYGPGRFVWLLRRVRALDEPIGARGQQKLWEWSAVGGAEAPY